MQSATQERGGHVFVNHEALMFRRGRIRAESFAHPLYAAQFKRPGLYARFLVRNYALRRGASQLPSGLWVIDTLVAGNYFHWTAEVLPRLLVAEQMYPQEGTLVLPRSFERDAYVAFSLRAFPHVRTIEWIEEDAKVRVDRLAFVPRPSPSDTFVPELVQEVARRLRHLAHIPKSGQRIYLSRADARHRRAANEEEVAQVLTAHDFRVVTVDPRDPQQQIGIAGGAEVIAGIHGAGLTNLMFMPPGGHVLEFRHPRDDLFPACYGPLAAACGHTYHAQRCAPTNPADEWEPLNHSDLVVDLDELREMLGKLS